MSGRSEIALNDKGRAEAHRLARRLARVPLAAIHTSPRRRAIETAEICAADHGLAVCATPALDEIDFGAWSGRSFADLEYDTAWRRWNAARAHAATPGGETMEKATSRAIDHIVALEGADPVLCVSHCDVIRGIAARCLGLDMDAIFAFDCDPASLTIVESDDARLRLVTLNERPQ